MLDADARRALESMMRATEDDATPIIRRLARIQARHVLDASAGGDAIPEYGPDDISHLEGLASYLDGYARDKGRAGLPASKSLFEEIAKRLREYDATRTPKPPAGGDAGAVEPSKRQVAYAYLKLRVSEKRDIAKAFGLPLPDTYCGQLDQEKAFLRSVFDAGRTTDLAAALALPAPVVEGATCKKPLQVPPVVEGGERLREALADLQKATGDYIENYLTDELEDPDFCGIDKEQHRQITAMAEAEQTARAALSEGRSHG